MTGSTDTNRSAERLILYIEVTSSAIVLAYTLAILYNDCGKPGQGHWAMAKVCQAIAGVFGKWGLDAEVRYRTILECERMI